ncbi:hypothetical protein CVS37_37730 [Burkholderia lata]|nr:hypothetical protein CVS37_37730 [Burkholderia lata]
MPAFLFESNLGRQGMKGMKIDMLKDHWYPIAYQCLGGLLALLATAGVIFTLRLAIRSVTSFG